MGELARVDYKGSASFRIVNPNGKVKRKRRSLKDSAGGGGGGTAKAAAAGGVEQQQQQPPPLGPALQAPNIPTIGKVWNVLSVLGCLFC